LPEAVINQILEDDVGQLWCGGTRGIFRATRAELNAEPALVTTAAH